jgi:hypothetical protein
MDGTYVGSPGQRGEIIRQIAVVNAFFAERDFSPCAKLRFGAPIPMGKPPTGEPCAGEPHARLGGRGGATLPDPYHHKISQIYLNYRHVDVTQTLAKIQIQ